MPEDKDYKDLLDDMRAKNIALEQQVEVWKNQWKGFQSYRESHWTIDVPKPSVHMGRRFSNVIGKLMSTDLERLHRIYIIVCICCVVAGALADIYRIVKES